MWDWALSAAFVGLVFAIPVLAAIGVFLLLAAAAAATTPLAARLDKGRDEASGRSEYTPPSSLRGAQFSGVHFFCRRPSGRGDEW